jgi:hypothetical protein
MGRASFNIDLTDCKKEIFGFISFAKGSLFIKPHVAQVCILQVKFFPEKPTYKPLQGCFSTVALCHEGRWRKLIA